MYSEKDQKKWQREGAPKISRPNVRRVARHIKRLDKMRDECWDPIGPMVLDQWEIGDYEIKMCLRELDDQPEMGREFGFQRDILTSMMQMPRCDRASALGLATGCWSIEEARRKKNQQAEKIMRQHGVPMHVAKRMAKSHHNFL